MYQVFYKKKFILLTDVIEEEKDSLVFPIKNVKFKKVIKLLNKKKIQHRYVYIIKTKISY
jgi:hypothetical protein